MAPQTKNVFISHVHEDDAGLQKLKDLLSSKGVAIRDASIHAGKENSANSPDYIKSQILAPQINWAGTFVVYITPKTKNSDWVNWEIEYAEKLGKRIVGVWAHGENECDIPDALDKYADAVVGWNGDKIIDAINGDIDEWDNPDGMERSPRPISRYSCAA
ncbi:MAG: TIR domain-containing protein [Hyphomicrobiales bacterium]